MVGKGLKDEVKIRRGKDIPGDDVAVPPLNLELVLDVRENSNSTPVSASNCCILGLKVGENVIMNLDPLVGAHQLLSRITELHCWKIVLNRRLSISPSKLREGGCITFTDSEGASAGGTDDDEDEAVAAEL